jgi:hypothetical protein
MQDFVLDDRIWFEQDGIIYVDQVSAIRYEYDRQKPITWSVSVGDDAGPRSVRAGHQSPSRCVCARFGCGRRGLAVLVKVPEHIQEQIDAAKDIEATRCSWRSDLKYPVDAMGIVWT